MHIIDTSSNKKHQVVILPVLGDDYKLLKANRYFFDWSVEKKHEVYKLQIVGSNDILGLISLEKIPAEWRIHIRLLTVSVENQGKDKEFERIAGNLIAFAAKIAVKEYAEHACISLRPKTQIAEHYINKYNMDSTGITISLMVPKILDLINHYDNEK